VPKRHPPEVRAAAVAAVATGEQPAAIAKRFGISQGLLHGWCEQDLPPVELSEVSRSDLARARTRERIAGIIYDSVVDLFAALRDQLQAASREDWLKDQNAADVASLVGSEVDGAIRLLAGFRPAEQPGESGDVVDAIAGPADGGAGYPGG
jgi:hypothetical protein